MLFSFAFAQLLAIAPPASAGHAVDQFDAEPARFLLRRASLDFGVRGGASIEGCNPCRLYGLSLSPLVAATVQVGWSRLAFVGELSTAPWPKQEYDVLYYDALRGSLGVSVGNAGARVSVVGFGGYISAGAEARLTVAPWLSRNGQRHGVQLSAGWNFFYGEIALAYRFVPARWGRRARL